MKFYFLLLGLLICFVSFSQKDATIIIKNAFIISMENSNKNSVVKSVLIVNDKIIAIDDFKNLAKPSNTKIINAKGKYLMPALAEMHAHLPNENNIDTFFKLNIAAGVAHIRVMNETMSQTKVLQNIANNKYEMAPQLFCSYIITRDMKLSELQMDSVMNVMKANKLHFIKLFGISDSLTFQNLMSVANKNNIVVCGQYPSKIKMTTVLNSGFKSIEHLGGIGTVSDSLVTDKIVYACVKNKIYNCPTFDWEYVAYGNLYPNNYSERLILKNAPKNFIKKWKADFKLNYDTTKPAEIEMYKDAYQKSIILKKYLFKRLYENKAMLLVGSDPSEYFQLPGFGMYDEMKIWFGFGIDNYTILQSATINAAKFFNEQQKWGSVTVGKNADLILLKKNPLINIDNIATVEKTITQGKIFDKKSILKSF